MDLPVFIPIHELFYLTFFPLSSWREGVTEWLGGHLACGHGQITTAGNSFVVVFSVNSKPLLKDLHFLTRSDGTRASPFPALFRKIQIHELFESDTIHELNEALDYPGVFAVRTKGWISVNSSYKGKGVIWHLGKLKLQTRVVCNEDVFFSKKLHRKQKLNILYK